MVKRLMSERSITLHTTQNRETIEAVSAGQLSAENTNKINRPTLSQMKGNKNDGLFINAKIHNTEVHCLIDTGSTMSVLHTTVFDQLPGQLKNQLLPYHIHLRMADGSPVVPLGIVKVPLQIDNQIVYQEMLVADVEIPAVLGYDFMTKNKCVINIPNHSVCLNDQTIWCILESQVPSLFRISLNQKVTIPALSEMIIKANPIKTLPVGTNVVIDSTSEALQIKGLLVAKTLCATNAEGLPLRMINVTDQPQTIYQNTFAAMAETVPDQIIINKFPLST